MIKSKKFILLLLLFLFIAGLLLRIYKLESIPVGFHIDEASKGYSGYSILKTGKDDNGNFLPLYIDIFGDNSPAGYHYLTIPSILLFHLTEFAVRFPGALIGALSVFPCYLLAYSIFRRKEIGIISAFLLTISPWHIILSRASSESLVSLFFILLGFGLILWSVRKQKSLLVFLGTFSLFLSFLFYQTPRLFVPLMFFALSIYLLKFAGIKLNQRFKKILILAFVILAFADFILIFGVSGGSGRFKQVNIFTYPETQLVLDEQIREDGVKKTSTLETRIAHNKAINFPLAYLQNYLEYFSWTFLFMKDLPPWYFVPNMGALYLVELPFVIIGLVYLSTNKKSMQKVPIIWLLLAPTAAATALDVNNLQRAIVMFPILEIIAAFAITQVIDAFSKQKKQIACVLIFGFFALNFLYFLHQYFIHSTIHRTWYRNNGFSQMMDKVKESYGGYDKVLITKSTGGIYPLIQFYMQYDPKIYQSEGSPKDKAYKGFGKFIFVPEECPSIKRDKNFPSENKIIYINNGECKDDLLHKEITIKREDGTPAFRVVYADKKENPLDYIKDKPTE